MPYEFCAKCKEIKNMVVPLTPGIITGPDRKVETITVKTYHCESCGAFVRSEEAAGEP